MEKPRDKALVTGAAGFIGSHICERLIGEGYQVTGIDSFTDYYNPGRKRRHLRKIISDPRFELVEDDLNRCDIGELLDDVSAVFHLAAQAGVRKSWGEDFICYVDSNITATQKLLEAVKDLGGVRIVYSSSSSVYGETEKLPMSEDDQLKPVSPYGVTKLSGEGLCELYRYNFGIDVVSLRYFTVYGPRQRPDMAFSRFLSSAITGGRIEIFGDGTQTRDFTFISDAVEANMLAMDYRGDQSIFNIGGGSRSSILKVLDIIRGISGSELEVDFIEKARGDVTDTWADTSRAEKELGFRPRIDLKEGLRREFEWYRNHIETEIS